MSDRIRVLIVDNSPETRQLLVDIFTADPDMEVVGTAADALEARTKIKALHPDVLTLEIEMPGMDGLTFLEKLMRGHPMPVVMVSTLTEKGADATLEALTLGAVDYITKPRLNVSAMIKYADKITARVKAAAKVNVRAHVATVKPLVVKLPSAFRFPASNKVVAIGSSTGGTEALVDLLSPLPPDFPGIVIVQHMPPAFTGPFSRRLDSVSQMHVKEAKDGDLIVRGEALVAPGGFHMEVVARSGQYAVRVYIGERINRHMPSVDVLFSSCAKHVRSNALGVILTGMGGDGSKGMLEMKQANGYTIAQDEASCVVFGMPKEAIRLGGVDRVLPLNRIGQALLHAVRSSSANL